MITGLWRGNLRERDHLGDSHRWDDNIKMGLQDVGCGVIDWIELAQDREPSDSIKCVEFLD